MPSKRPGLRTAERLAARLRPGADPGPGPARKPGPVRGHVRPNPVLRAVLRPHHAPSREFHRYTAKYSIPRTNPFLRDFFSYITGPQLSDEPYGGFVDDLIQVLAKADMHAILADFGRTTRQDDPMMHFYETFLAAYDPKLKERRGVYYTPMPVVSFIVRSVDELLKTRFNLPQGLADTTRLPDGTHKVLVLDPAVGTATFLYAVIDLIRDEFMARNDAGMWSGYVRDHLLKRIFGFEIMMAPYAVAHFKLALQLAGHDLDLPEEQRARWRMTSRPMTASRST
jgi:hypothetical protein